MKRSQSVVVAQSLATLYYDVTANLVSSYITGELSDCLLEVGEIYQFVLYVFLISGVTLAALLRPSVVSCFFSHYKNDLFKVDWGDGLDLAEIS